MWPSRRWDYANQKKKTFKLFMKLCSQTFPSADFLLFFSPARYIGSLEGSINVFYYSSKEVPIHIVMLLNIASVQYMTNILICTSLNCSPRFVTHTCTRTHLNLPVWPRHVSWRLQGNMGLLWLTTVIKLVNKEISLCICWIHKH